MRSPGTIRICEKCGGRQSAFSSHTLVIFLAWFMLRNRRGAKDRGYCVAGSTPLSVTTLANLMGKHQVRTVNWIPWRWQEYWRYFYYVLLCTDNLILHP